MIKQVFTTENFSSRMGAEFESNEAAQRAAQAVREQAPGGGPLVVEVIEPGDQGADRKLEPESDRIPATMVRSHLVAGTAGLILGMLLAGALIAAGVQPLAASPAWSAAVFSALGLMLGLLVGGLIGFRPDHDPLIFAAKSALKSGRSYVVVHTDDSGNQRAAQRILRQHGDRRRRSL